jgi:hypothetical protein
VAVVVAVVVVRAGLSSQPRIVLRMRRAPNRESAWRDPNRTRDDNQYHDGRRCMTTLKCAACNAQTRHALLREFRHDGLDRMTGSAISRRRVCTSSRTAVLQCTADLLLPSGPPPNPQTVADRGSFAWWTCRRSG